MGLLAKLFRRVTDQEIILVHCIGGPLDGAFEEIRRADIAETPRGRVWQAKWRERVFAVYAFETLPELAWREGVIRNCYAGRFVGWEKRSG